MKSMVLFSLRPVALSSGTVSYIIVVLFLGVSVVDMDDLAVREVVILLL
jgi:hypothetical protein